jgi:hypothetical protein
MPVYPKSANIQVKNKVVNTKPKSQLAQKPPPLKAQPVVSTLPYHPAKMAQKRYKKK